MPSALMGCSGMGTGDWSQDGHIGARGGEGWLFSSITGVGGCFFSVLWSHCDW